MFCITMAPFIFLCFMSLFSTFLQTFSKLSSYFIMCFGWLSCSSFFTTSSNPTKVETSSRVLSTITILHYDNLLISERFFFQTLVAEERHRASACDPASVCRLNSKTCHKTCHIKENPIRKLNWIYVRSKSQFEKYIFAWNLTIEFGIFIKLHENILC